MIFRMYPLMGILENERLLSHWLWSFSWLVYKSVHALYPWRHLLILPWNHQIWEKMWPPYMDQVADRLSFKWWMKLKWFTLYHCIWQSDCQTAGLLKAAWSLGNEEIHFLKAGTFEGWTCSTRQERKISIFCCVFLVTRICPIPEKDIYYCKRWWRTSV